MWVFIRTFEFQWNSRNIPSIVGCVHWLKLVNRKLRERNEPHSRRILFVVRSFTWPRPSVFFPLIYFCSEQKVQCQNWPMQLFGMKDTKCVYVYIASTTGACQNSVWANWRKFVEISSIGNHRMFGCAWRWKPMVWRIHLSESLLVMCTTMVVWPKNKYMFDWTVPVVHGRQIAVSNEDSFSLKWYKKQHPTHYFMINLVNGIVALLLFVTNIYHLRLSRIKSIFSTVKVFFYIDQHCN